MTTVSGIRLMQKINTDAPTEQPTTPEPTEYTRYNVQIADPQFQSLREIAIVSGDGLTIIKSKYAPTPNVCTIEVRIRSDYNIMFGEDPNITSTIITEATPQRMATSEDGKLLAILTSTKVHVFEITDETVVLISTIPYTDFEMNIILSSSCIPGRYDGGHKYRRKS